MEKAPAVDANAKTDANRRILIDVLFIFFDLYQLELPVLIRMLFLPSFAHILVDLYPCIERIDNIDPVKLSESFGVEAMDATDESSIAGAIEHGLKMVEDEKRPFLLNVHLPIGLPEGGRPKAPYSFSDDLS